MTENIAYEELINGCISGDRTMQKRLYELFYGKMMIVCLRYAPDRQEAKDILQEGFLKVFQNIEKYTFEGSLEGWIRKIIVNTAIDHVRKNRQKYKLFDTKTPFKEVDVEEEPIDENEWNQLSEEDILEALIKLPPAYRTVFNLYVMDNFSHHEISQKLKISIGTSKSNLAKARMNLKKMLTNLRIAK